MDIHTDGIEIKRDFVSNSINDSIKNEVTKSQEAALKSGIREADKKFISIKARRSDKERHPTFLSTEMVLTDNAIFTRATVKLNG